MCGSAARPGAQLRSGHGFGFDGIELTDARKRFAGNGCVPGLGDVVEAAPEVAPAVGEHKRTAPLIGRIRRSRRPAGCRRTRRAASRHARRRVRVRRCRRRPAGRRHPRGDHRERWPIDSRFRLSSSRIEHRTACLVGKELRRSFLDRNEPIVQRCQFVSGKADPMRQRRAIDSHTFACQEAASAEAAISARSFFNHPNSCDGLRSCRRATCETTAPGSSASAVIASQTSSGQRRRRSAPFNTSIRRGR